jgi:hypothetical protein
VLRVPRRADQLLGISASVVTPAAMLDSSSATRTTWPTSSVAGGPIDAARASAGRPLGGVYGFRAFTITLMATRSCRSGGMSRRISSTSSGVNSG